MSFQECFITFKDFDADKDKISFYQNLFWLKGFEYNVCIGLIPSNIQIKNDDSIKIRKMDFGNTKEIEHYQLIVVVNCQTEKNLAEKIIRQVLEILNQFKEINYIKYNFSYDFHEGSIIVYFDKEENQDVLKFCYLFFQHVSIVKNAKCIKQDFLEIETFKLWCELL